MQKVIRPDQVALGMHVLGFEGSWLQHPFWKRNFTINDSATLEKVRQSQISGVIIRVEPDAPTVPTPSPIAAPLSSPPLPSHVLKVRKSGISADMRENVRQAIATPPVRNDDYDRAKAVLKDARKTMHRVFEQVRSRGSVKPADVSRLVDDLTESVIRNPEVMINITRLKSKSDYTCMHSVAVSTLMINFTRSIGLPESSFRSIGLAGLLHDLGKLAISDDILNKTGRLTEAEFEEIKGHTLAGRDLIADCTDIPEAAIDVCTHHHEKMNGRGYPFGLAGEALSLNSRMGAICDVYDALTSERSYKSGYRPQEAIATMSEGTGHFDPELFFQFQRSIMMFAPGTIVELRSQRLGLILPISRRHPRLHARAFFDMRRRDFVSPVDVELGESMRFDLAMRLADGARWGLPTHPDIIALVQTGGDPRGLADRLAKAVPPLASQHSMISDQA
ncbi:MAG: HD-GYP domain-containing protein [Alphaproteobacteria bacterium]|nr:HD-GYP domain-containing protein [Alphaproteobacteria bacterium]MBU0794594.1 HD-GYP domain-containing protein [Alphaproteobacteria bacterium]MBU0876272.1 HD-GYP domain-containing protein [Alphaproteobacteria bacterium]MBU1768197.1 HD-GYP domain-containing protein [Alphaproteobacteria bacterium]